MLRGGSKFNSNPHSVKGDRTGSRNLFVMWRFLLLIDEKRLNNENTGNIYIKKKQQKYNKKFMKTNAIQNLD